MKNKFNIIDFMVIAVLIIAIVFVSFKFFGLGNFISPQHMVEATYTVRIAGLKEISMNEIPDKGEVRDGDGAYMGKILSKKAVVAEEINQLSDGTYKKVKNDEKFDVYLEISCNGLQKDDGFYFDAKKNYGINSNVYLDAETIAFEGKIQTLTVEN